jgi:hypothetical protein
LYAPLTIRRHLFCTGVKALLNPFSPSSMSCQLGAAYANTLRITTAYTCLALDTLVPYAKAANLLNASIWVTIFPLTLTKWFFQNSLLLSQTPKNLAFVIGCIITVPRRKSSLQAAFALLKCNSSLFSGANSMPVFWNHFSQIFHAASNKSLLASNVPLITSKFVSFANPIIINCG